MNTESNIERTTDSSITAVADGIGINVDLTIPKTAADVLPINYETALASFPEQEREEVVTLSKSINVAEIDKVMNYGSIPLKATFEQCGKFLKDEQGSDADQKVIAQVVELSKKASESYDDFNIVLKDPSFLQKIFLKLSKNARKSRMEKIQNSAVTNYKLLGELKSSCDSWIEMLKKAMGDISYSIVSDYETIGLLEKYIIAGKIAENRIESEMKAMQDEYQRTGLQKYAQQYEQYRKGYETFQITMANLEKSRVAYKLSIAQLGLTEHGNRNVQITIHTQINNSLALIGQQLRNAILNEKTREVLEGQKLVTRLNDELIKNVSKSVGITTEETEKLLYNGFFNLDAAKEAVTTVISSCNEIKKIATEMLPKMKAETSEVNKLLEELEPHIIGSIETVKEEGTNALSSNNNGTDRTGLVF